MASSIDRIRLVLGTIIVLAEPLSIEGLGQLLHLEIGDVRLALRGLYSVLSVPDQIHEPVNTLHKSLHDFLTDRQRSQIYYINSTIRHCELARTCLGFMRRELRYDICGIGDPSRLNSEVTDLRQRRDTRISRRLWYACCHWAFHVSRAPQDYDLLAEVRAFVFQYILYWIETLSILDDLGYASPSIDNALQWLQVRHFETL